MVVGITIRIMPFFDNQNIPDWRYDLYLNFGSQTINKFKRYMVIFYALYDGTKVKSSRNKLEYFTLQKLVCNREKNGFRYINRHLEAHSELNSLEEPVQESKKVTDFLTGIHYNNMDTTKSQILASTTMKTSLS